MAKDKKAGKKDKKSKSARLLKAKPVKAAATKVKDWSQNPLVADIVAAALVAAAAALKDSRKAQRLAAEAGDEIEKLTKKSARRGNELWQMALDIGRRSLDELGESKSKGAKPKASKPRVRKTRRVPQRNTR